MNKHQKALDRMDKNCDNYIENCNSVYTFLELEEDNLTLQELVDKAIPMKPIKNHDNTMLCPNCILDDDCVRLVGFENNCPICSQAINWAEELFNE